jgi:putative ABC transport system permease protein
VFSLRMLLASLRARRARLVLALLAVTVGVAVATTLATLALQVGDDFARTLRAAGPNFVVLPAGARLPIDAGAAMTEGSGTIAPPRAAPRLPETAVAALKRGFWKNSVLEAAPELDVGVVLDRLPEASRSARAVLTGTWRTHTVGAGDDAWHTGIARLHPTWRLDGAWPRPGAAELALGPGYARELQARPGDAIHVRYGAPGDTVTVRVTGILTASGPEDYRAWTSLETAQAWSGRPGEIDRIWVSALVLPKPSRPAPDATRDPKAYEKFMCAPYPDHVANDLHQQLDGADVRPMSELVAGEGEVVSRLNRLMLLLALAALAASALGVFSTATAGVVERRIELGLLRALGAGSGQIAGLLLGETLLVSAAGGVLGFLLGVAGAAAIRGRTFGHALDFPAALLPVALLVSVALALAGTLGPLRAALRVDPARVLRG